jgi:transposase
MERLECKTGSPPSVLIWPTTAELSKLAAGRESSTIKDDAMCETDRLGFWTKLLNLDGFQVVHEALTAPDDPLCFTVIPKTPLGVCPHCQSVSEDIHRRCDSDRVRDLAIGQRAVELTVRTYQYWCNSCDRAFTPPAPGLAPGGHATERFLEQARQLIRFSDIANVASFLGVPENTLARWYYDYIERRHQVPIGPEAQPIRQLGIDELSLKKSTVSSLPS